MSDLKALCLGAACLAVSGTAASAADLTVDLDLPNPQSAAYHRPYLAVWVERADGAPAGTLAVWYDLRVPNGHGVMWLRNLRTWWRGAGQALTLPADGVSGATRAPGRQTLRFAGNRDVLAGLPDGDYSLVIEAAREQGGRELVRTPFQWRKRPSAPRTTTRASGSTEIGAVAVTVLR